MDDRMSQLEVPVERLPTQSSPWELEPPASLALPVSPCPQALWQDLAGSGNLSAPRPDASSSWRGRPTCLPLPVPPGHESPIPAEGQGVGEAGAPAVSPGWQWQGYPEKQR